MNLHYFSQDIGVLGPLPQRTVQETKNGMVAILPFSRPISLQRYIVRKMIDSIQDKSPLLEDQSCPFVLTKELQDVANQEWKRRRNV